MTGDPGLRRCSPDFGLGIEMSQAHSTTSGDQLAHAGQAGFPAALVMLAAWLFWRLGWSEDNVVQAFPEFIVAAVAADSAFDLRGGDRELRQPGQEDAAVRGAARHRGSWISGRQNRGAVDPHNRHGFLRPLAGRRDRGRRALALHQPWSSCQLPISACSPAQLLYRRHSDPDDGDLCALRAELGRTCSSSRRRPPRRRCSRSIVARC